MKTETAQGGATVLRIGGDGIARPKRPWTRVEGKIAFEGWMRIFEYRHSDHDSTITWSLVATYGTAPKPERHDCFVVDGVDSPALVIDARGMLTLYVCACDPRFASVRKAVFSETRVWVEVRV